MNIRETQSMFIYTDKETYMHKYVQIDKNRYIHKQT